MERTLNLKKRQESGKSANHKLRTQGLVPVNVISNGESKLASVVERELQKLIDSGIRNSTLLDLNMEGTGSFKGYVKEVQRYPHTGTLRHVDFYKVIPNKKVITKIGIKTEGIPKGSKAGGQFEHVLHEIKVKSLPEDFLDEIKVDVTHLEIGDSIKVSELNVPKSWEIISNKDSNIATVSKTKALLAQEKAESKDAKAAEPAKASAKTGKTAESAKAAPAKK